MQKMHGLVHFINASFDYWFQNEKPMCGIFKEINKIKIVVFKMKSRVVNDVSSNPYCICHLK